MKTSRILYLMRGNRRVDIVLQATRVIVPGALPQWGINRLEAWDGSRQTKLTAAESAKVLRNLP